MKLTTFVLAPQRGKASGVVSYTRRGILGTSMDDDPDEVGFGEGRGSVWVHYQVAGGLPHNLKLDRGAAVMNCSVG